jgi:hypothetical protein
LLNTSEPSLFDSIDSKIINNHLSAIKDMSNVHSMLETITYAANRQIIFVPERQNHWKQK